MNTADTIEEVCLHCKSSVFLRQIPGQFRDFDADVELHGTIGIPLCSKCLGTGKNIDTSEFLELQEEVSKLRSNNLGIQINAKEIPDWAETVRANNDRLREIAKKALELIKKPETNCLAKVLIER